jgi:uncharacterized protein (DUF924 family)
MTDKGFLEMPYREILKFWFEEIKPTQWWVKDPDFDKLITGRFSEVHARAARCELFEWRSDARGRLAEIIVLDQFSRNMFRGTPLAFASDSLALALSQEAISAGADKELHPVERSFLYIPFMHSETRVIHEVAMVLYQKNGLQNNLDFEIRHKQIIDRFGRYPHRNGILGRASTEEEIEFLKQPGSGF